MDDNKANGNGPPPGGPEPEKECRRDGAGDYTFRIKRRHVRVLCVALLMLLAYMLGAFSASASIYRGRGPSLFGSKITNAPPAGRSFDVNLFKGRTGPQVHIIEIPDIPDIPEIPEIWPFGGRGGNGAQRNRR